MADEQHIGAQYFTGEDKALVFTISDAAGAPQNIGGWAISWMVKRKRTDADSAAMILKTTANGGVVLTTPSSGICTVTVTDTDVEVIQGEVVYYHELKRTDPGVETVLSYGSFVLKQAVHQ